MPDLQLVADLPGHNETAWAVAFNPTRPLLASCSTDKTVRLFSYTLPPLPVTSTLPSASSSKPPFQYLSTLGPSHKRTVRSLAWAPSGRTLATASFDSSVGIWEEATPRLEDDDDIEGIERRHMHEDDEEDTDMDDAPMDAAGIEWECVTTLEGHESECKSVGWSSDGALLASCSRDKSVWVWEVQPDSDFECISVMMEHQQDVKSLAWHPHEEILASASYDAQIHLLFDDPDGDWGPFQKLSPRLPARRIELPTDSDPALRFALSLTSDERGAIEELKIPPLEEDETVWCLAWSPCGRYLASGGDLGGIRIWTRTGQQPDSHFVETVHVAAHTRSCFSMSWSSGGMPEEQGGLGLLATGGGDSRIIIHQISSSDGSLAGKNIAVSVSPVAAAREAHGVSDVNCVNWCLREDGKGQGMLASAGDDGSVRVWRFVA